MHIGNWEPGKGTFVIAEIGSNHNGDFALARQMIREAAQCGVDAVKFQIYDPGQLIRPDIRVMSHVQGQHRTQLERFHALQFSHPQYRELADLAAAEGVCFLASVFDPDSVDFLDALAPVFKIASCDLTHLSLLRYVAAKGKSVILSTGMGGMPEIADAVRQFPPGKIMLLHCVSLYPTPMESANLKSIPYLSERFQLPVGYSDHTLGTTACLIAVALGACLIEKHFTLDTNQAIGDHKLSVEPNEMRTMVERIRAVEAALGDYDKRISGDEAAMRRVMRRSLVAKEDIAKGTRLTKDMLIALRPADGVSPARLDAVLDKRTLRDIAKGEPLAEEDVRW